LICFICVCHIFGSQNIIKIIALPFAFGERKKIGLSRFAGLCCFATPNFQIQEQKLIFNFKNPYKIVAESEPERSEGEAIIARNSYFQNWRYLLDKIRTFFDENPDIDF